MMLRKMPARMAGAAPQVVDALVAKLGASQSSPLVASLLVVLAQLAHADAQRLLDFLAAQPAPGLARPCSTPILAPLASGTCAVHAAVHRRQCTPARKAESSKSGPPCWDDV